MSSNIDALFSGMQTAPMFSRGNYMAQGLYKVELTKVFVKARFKGGNVFVAEFKVLESNNPAHAIGSSGSWVPKLELPNTFGDIKALVFSALGTDPKSVKPEDTAQHAEASLLARAACGSDTAAAELKAAGLGDASIVGAVVALECTQTKTKENRDFTRYTWSPGETATAVAA